MKKIIVFGLICGVLLMATNFSVHAIERLTATIKPDVKIEINGEKLDLPEPVVTINGRTYVPFRFLMEEVMGLTVEWDEKTQTIYANYGEGILVPEPTIEQIQKEIEQLDLKIHAFEKYLRVGGYYEPFYGESKEEWEQRRERMQSNANILDAYKTLRTELENQLREKTESLEEAAE